MHQVILRYKGMSKTQKLLKWAEVYQTKHANISIELPALKKVVKDTVEDLWSKHPKEMDGFVYISGVNFSRGMGETVFFTLHLDKDKQDIVNTNKPQRDTLINSAVKAALKQNFNQDFDLGYTDVLV